MNYKLDYQTPLRRTPMATKICVIALGVLSIVSECSVGVLIAVAFSLGANPGGGGLDAAVPLCEALACLILGSVFGLVGFFIGEAYAETLGVRINMFGLVFAGLWMLLGIIGFSWAYFSHGGL